MFVVSINFKCCCVLWNNSGRATDLTLITSMHFCGYNMENQYFQCTV